MQQYAHMPQDVQRSSPSRRSECLMILAAVRNGMAVLLTGRPTVISLAQGGMHGSCRRAESRLLAGRPHAAADRPLCTDHSTQKLLLYGRSMRVHT